VSVEVRRCASADELVGALRPIWHFFGSVPEGEAVERFSRVLEVERMHAAWEDGRIVGGAGAFTFELTVPGGTVPAAGVTVVGVLPTHRRRGVLRTMMREQLDDVHRRGEPVAILWASEEPIYTRFGYGLASLSGAIELPRLRTDFRSDFEGRGRVRLVDDSEALDRFPPVYERVRAVTPGMFVRSREWWQVRRLWDQELSRGGGGGVMVRALLEVDGRDAGYALYRLHPRWEAGSPAGHVEVIEAVGDSPQATAEVWRFVLDMDWVASVKAGLLPVDTPLMHLLDRPRQLHLTVGDGLWLRLVDVEAALAARTYRVGAPVVIEVADAFCPWNAGTYVVGPDGARRTGAEPELLVTAETLGAVYLGGSTFGQLARALRVSERTAGAVARADALFATDRAPWCPEIF